MDPTLPSTPSVELTSKAASRRPTGVPFAPFIVGNGGVAAHHTHRGDPKSVQMLRGMRRDVLRIKTRGKPNSYFREGRAAQ